MEEVRANRFRSNNIPIWSVTYQGKEDVRGYVIIHASMCSRGLTTSGHSLLLSGSLLTVTGGPLVMPII